jgi:hypothetical protein
MVLNLFAGVLQDEPKSRKSSKIRKIFFAQIVSKLSETYKKSIFSNKKMEKNVRLCPLGLRKNFVEHLKKLFSQIVLKVSNLTK